MNSLLNEETNLGRYFSITIHILIVISLITFSLSTLPDLSSSQKYILDVIELITVVIFTFEYLLRIVFSKNKLKYIFSFYGIVDLCSILPFFLSSQVDLRSLRTLRMLRLLRIAKLIRYNEVVSKYKNAIIEIKGELILFFSFTMITMYLAAVGIFYFENPAQPEVFSSIFSSLWWAVATLTTVGYGDIFPITAGGKVFTFVILMIGLGIVAVPTGLLASALTKRD